MVSTTVCHIAADDIFMISQVATGKLKRPPDFERIFLHHYKAAMVFTLLYITSLWIVKLSFLLFFQRLVQALDSWMRWWWSILAFIVLTYVLNLGMFPFQCVDKPLDEFMVLCSARSLTVLERMYVVNCVSDVCSDVISESQVI